MLAAAMISEHGDACRWLCSLAERAEAARTARGTDADTNGLIRPACVCTRMASLEAR